MARARTTDNCVDFVARVRQLVADRIGVLPLPFVGEGVLPQLMPGKMLRTRLAARLLRVRPTALRHENVARLCAATEMAHTASLCHDDIIDRGLVRRGHAALWRVTSRSAAVLIGDLLLCEALDLLLHTESGRYMGSFVSKVREVCAAESEQELRWRGKPLDSHTCLRLARGKTGPFFAFVGQACGGDDKALSSALEEAGYRIGTAYQIADDLLDMTEKHAIAGKTLGTDSKRGKFTLAHDSVAGASTARKHVAELCSSALECLNAWPRAQDALAHFLVDDLQPALPADVCRLEARAEPPTPVPTEKGSRPENAFYERAE